MPPSHTQSAAPVSCGASGYTFLFVRGAPAFELDGYKLAEKGWSRRFRTQSFRGNVELAALVVEALAHLGHTRF